MKPDSSKIALTVAYLLFCYVLVALFLGFWPFQNLNFAGEGFRLLP